MYSLKLATFSLVISMFSASPIFLRGRVSLWKSLLFPSKNKNATFHKSGVDNLVPCEPVARLMLYAVSWSHSHHIDRSQVEA